MSSLDRASIRAQSSADDRELLDTIQDVSKVKDLDTLLERVLMESRRFASADAGTIYIVAGNYLYFLCVQNDTLFSDERPVDKYNYTMARLPVNKQSLAGYVAATGDPLMIDDVYDIILLYLIVIRLICKSKTEHSLLLQVCFVNSGK